MKNSSLFFLLLFFANLAFAQGKDPEVKITLRDGNTMSGTTKLGNISLVTDYGKLEIPVKNVSFIEVGITPDKSLGDKISNLVKQLSSSNEEMRKNSYNELSSLSIGAIPVLSDFIYSAKYTPGSHTDYTAEGALQDLMGRHNIRDGYNTKDVVTIDYMYTMGGQYDFKKVDLKTEYGMLSIPKEKIKSLEIMYMPGDGSEMVFVLQASKHISSNTNGGWLKTGIMVKPGQKLNIVATGEVTLQSLSGNKYKPDGTVTGTGAGGGGYDEGYDEGGGGAGGTYPVYGNVVFKVGEAGQPMKAGAKFSGSVNASGMLYLSIYETVYNTSNSGSYTVKLGLK